MFPISDYKEIRPMRKVFKNQNDILTIPEKSVKLGQRMTIDLQFNGNYGEPKCQIPINLSTFKKGTTKTLKISYVPGNKKWSKAKPFKIRKPTVKEVQEE